MKQLRVKDVSQDKDKQNWYVYEYARRAMTVDVACFLTSAENLIEQKINKNNTKILVVKRLQEPYKHQWCLPGGFVDEHEETLDAGIRELKEETNISVDNLILNQIYSNPARDSRGVITVSYIALFTQKPELKADGVEVSAASWKQIAKIKEYGFDHRAIVNDAFTKLQNSFSKTN